MEQPPRGAALPPERGGLQLASWNRLIAAAVAGALIRMMMPGSGLPPRRAPVGTAEEAIAAAREAVAKVGILGATSTSAEAFLDTRGLPPGKFAPPTAGFWAVTLRGGGPSVEAVLNLNGELAILDQQHPPAMASPRLGPPAARALAESFVLPRYPAGALQLTAEIATEHGAHLDHTYAWDAPQGVRVRARVSGSRLTMFAAMHADDDQRIEGLGLVGVFRSGAKGGGVKTDATAAVIGASAIAAIGVLILARRRDWERRSALSWLALLAVFGLVTLAQQWAQDHSLTSAGMVLLITLTSGALVLLSFSTPAALAVLGDAAADGRLLPTFRLGSLRDGGQTLGQGALLGVALLGPFSLAALLVGQALPGSVSTTAWAALASNAWAGPLGALQQQLLVSLLELAAFAFLLSLTGSKWAASAAVGIAFASRGLYLNAHPEGAQWSLGLLVSGAMLTVLVTRGPLLALATSLSFATAASLVDLVRFDAGTQAPLALLSLFAAVFAGLLVFDQVGRRVAGQPRTTASADHHESLTPTAPTLLTPPAPDADGVLTAPSVTPGGSILPNGEGVTLRPGVLVAGRYTLLSELGSGGMGRVFKARDRSLDVDVALKFLRADLLSDAAYVERFREEVRLARRVSHPNVCRVHDLVETPETGPFLSMEFVEGEALARTLRRRWPLNDVELLALVQQICAALDVAHALGIVHRDLKPDNVVLDGAGRAVVMDFGIARTVEGPRRTASGTMLGTPQYMAPEQVDGRAVSPQTDVYSLGVMLFELVTGKLPFAGATPLAVAMQHLNQPPPDPALLHAGLSPAVALTVLRCLEKEPGRRFARAGEVAQALAAAMQPRS